MKKISRIVSMLMVVMMLVANIAPFNTITIHAAGSVTEVGAYPDKDLKIGNKLQLWIEMKGDFDSNPSDYYVELSGAIEKKQEPYVTATNDGVTLTLNDLEYTGRSQTVEIEVWYQDNISYRASKTFNDSDVLEDASDALTIMTNTVNVVAGESQRVTLTFRNDSSIRSEEAQVKLSIPDSNADKLIKLRTTEFTIPELNRNQEREIQITIDIDEEIPQGLYDMEVEINGVTRIVKLRVDSSFMPPSLEITASKTDGFSPDKAQDVTINLKNVGHSGARNVKVEIVQDSNIYVMDGSNVRYINSIGAEESGEVTFRLQVGSSELSTVPVQLRVTYIDNEGEQKEDTQYIYLNTSGSTLEQGVIIENIVAPGGVYGAGEPFNVKFTVSAPTDIENVQIRLEGSDTIVPMDRNLFIIESMKAGETREFSSTFMATSAAKSETHLLGINVSYPLNSSLSEHSQFTTVQINNPDGENSELKGQPKVIIGQYQSMPTVVQAGENFDLSIGFLNTHRDQSVYNLKANITVTEKGEDNTGSVFTPVGASNTFYIAEMSPGEIVNKDITMYTIPTATPKTYEVVFEMEYEDADGNQITANEYIGIPVEQVTELEVVEVVTDMVEVGRDSNLRAQIFNKGKTDISNVIISTEGEGFTVEDNKMTEGLLTRGDIIYYEPILYPYEEGLLQGQIVIEYEDVNGQVHTMIEEFEMEVFPAYVPEINPGEGEDWGMDLMPPDFEEESPSKMPALLGVVLGMGIAAGITAIVLKKRQDKLDEFDDDED